MFKKILVPLDGSKLAECALSYAEGLAKTCDSTKVVLISVTERVTGSTKAPESYEIYAGSDRSGYVSSVSGSSYMQSGSMSVTFGKMEKQAEKYLEKIENRLTKKGIPMESQVLVGKPADEIAKFAE